MSAVRKDANGKPAAEAPLRPSFIQGAISNGTLDMPPQLHKFSLIFFPFYLSLVPLARGLTRQTGYFSILLDKVYGPRDTKSIAALALLGAFNTYLFSAVGSVYGQSMHARGYQNNTPRLIKEQLRGFAHRLTAAHQSLLEVFPGFAFTASLVFAARLNGAAKQTSLIDGLFLHFFLKNVLFYICYLVDDDFNRSGAHVFSISTLLSVLHELYTIL